MDSKRSTHEDSELMTLPVVHDSKMLYRYYYFTRYALYFKKPIHLFSLSKDE